MSNIKITAYKISNQQKLLFAVLLTLIIGSVLTFAFYWLLMLSNLQKENSLTLEIKKIQSEVMDQERDLVLVQNDDFALDGLVKMQVEKYLARDAESVFAVAQ